MAEESHNVAVGEAANGPKTYNLKREKDVLSRFDVLTSQPVTLMSEGKAHYTSLVGSVLSIIFLIIALIVVLGTLVNVGNRPEAIIARTVQDGYFENIDGQQHVKFEPQGFNIAFGLTSTKKAKASKEAVPEESETDAEISSAMLTDPNYGFIEVWYEGEKIEVEKCEKAATSFYKFGARSQAALKENFAKGRFFCPTAESFKKMSIKHPSVDGTE